MDAARFAVVEMGVVPLGQALTQVVKRLRAEHPCSLCAEWPAVVKFTGHADGKDVPLGQACRFHVHALQERTVAYETTTMEGTFPLEDVPLLRLAKALPEKVE